MPQKQSPYYQPLFDRDGKPVLLQGKQIICVPLRDVFPFWFDADGNPKKYPQQHVPKQCIYAVRHGGDSTLIKIGITGDIKKRLESLQVGNPFKIKLAYMWEIEHPRRIEKKLHVLFSLTINRESGFLCKNLKRNALLLLWKF